MGLSMTGQVKHFRVGLQGHRVTLYTGAKGTDGKPLSPPSLRPGAPVSHFSGESAASIVVPAYTEDDAKGVFCRLNGIRSSVNEWSVRETLEPTTPIEAGETGQDAPPAEVARVAAGAAAARKLLSGGESAALTEEELEEERDVAAFRAARRAAKPAPADPTNPLQTAPKAVEKKGGAK